MPKWIDEIVAKYADSIEELRVGQIAEIGPHEHGYGDVQAVVADLVKVLAHVYELRKKLHAILEYRNSEPYAREILDREEPPV